MPTKQGNKMSTSTSTTSFFNQLISFLALSAKNQKLVMEVAKVISEKEWESRMLSKESMATLGLKGSPKLSKILLSAGVPQQKMEMALSGSKASGLKLASSKSDLRGHKLGQEVEWIWDQGNSIHYSSCQTDNSNYDKREGDLSHWRSGDLLLWTVGEPYSHFQEGYIARAKARVMYKTSGEIAGLYIDRPYGQYNLLLEEVDHLLSLWHEYSGTRTPLFFPPVWRRDNGAGNCFEAEYGGLYKTPLVCPSSKGGYQDTLGGDYPTFSCFTAVGGGKSVTHRAYRSRHKIGGTYVHKTGNVGFNAQKAEFVNPPTPKAREFVLHPFVANTLHKWGFRKINLLSGGVSLHGKKYRLSSHLVGYGPNHRYEVRDDSGAAIGFIARDFHSLVLDSFGVESLPYRYSPEGGLVVSIPLRCEGFAGFQPAVLISDKPDDEDFDDFDYGEMLDEDFDDDDDDD